MIKLHALTLWAMLIIGSFAIVTWAYYRGMLSAKLFKMHQSNSATFLLLLPSH